MNSNTFNSGIYLSIRWGLWGLNCWVWIGLHCKLHQHRQCRQEHSQARGNPCRFSRLLVEPAWQWFSHIHIFFSWGTNWKIDWDRSKNGNVDKRNLPKKFKPLKIGLHIDVLLSKCCCCAGVLEPVQIEPG